MKTITRFVVMLAVIAMSAQAVSAATQNKVKVMGDLTRDGYLTIDVDWMVDSAKYSGATNDVVRQKVREEIWEKLLPQLVKKTSGYPVSYDKSNFTKLSENIKLIEQRPDGTTLDEVKIKVRFYCPRHAGPAKNVQQASKKKTDEELKYRFVRGI
jgi:hypothetical protein